MQPVIWDGRGVIRFQQNKIVSYLLDRGGLTLNHLHGLGQDAPDFPDSDWDQFNQLIGYSVSAAPIHSKATQAEADERAEQLRQRYPVDPALLSTREGEKT